MVCAALSGLQSRKATKRDAGTSGEWLDALCRPESAALRVAPRRPPASSRASTVFPDTLFGPLLAERTPGRDAGRDPGEKCGLAHDPTRRDRIRLAPPFACSAARQPPTSPRPSPPPGAERGSRRNRHALSPPCGGGGNPCPLNRVPPPPFGGRGTGRGGEHSDQGERRFRSPAGPRQRRNPCNH